jgi:predicted nucleotidyltransferase
MVSALPKIATQLGTNKWALYRAVNRGAIRCFRPSPRSLEFPPGEIDYLREHWEILSTLIQAFSTEPNVKLAVLYGSLARGDENSDSDADVLIDFYKEDVTSISSIAMRLGNVLGRSVDIAQLSHIKTGFPLLLLQAIDDGRVMIDKDNMWKGLQTSRSTILRAAKKQQKREREEASKCLEQLMNEDIQ